MEPELGRHRESQGISHSGPEGTHSLGGRREGEDGALPTLSLSHCLSCIAPALESQAHQPASIQNPYRNPSKPAAPDSHQHSHMQRTSSLPNTQHGFPLTPLNITPTFTHSHTHTPTHTSCLYTDTHNSIHQDGAQPKHRSLARTRTAAPILSLLGLLLSCPQQGRKPSPVRGHAGEAGDTGVGPKGRKTVEHSVSQSSRAAGGSGRYPWCGERPLMPCKM